MMTAKEWNRKYPIGTAVEFRLKPSEVFTTRALALNHSCGQPQIWLFGLWGSINLSDIRPKQVT